MATNYDINYNDSRFTKVETAKNDALNEVDETYGKMISQADSYFNNQIDAVEDYKNEQTKLQNQQTDLAIKEINQQKEQAKKDYTKEQSGAYVDWQKQSDQYGANAEQMASQGLAGSGYSESAQVSMYNTYQNRVTAARESYNLAVMNYNNSIKEAQLANSSVLAEIAYNALQKQLELSLQGFQYKNQLIIEKANKKTEVDRDYYSRYQDVLKQINTENALAEEVRQYNATLAEEKRQFNILHPSDGGTSGKTTTNTTMSGGVIKGGQKDTGNSKVTKGQNGMVNLGDDGGGKKTGEPNGIANRHGNSWIEIPGHGRFSYQEVLAYVESGQVKETVVDGKLKYTWVKKSGTGKNVTPDAKGYAAKQRELFG